MGIVIKKSMRTLAVTYLGFTIGVVNTLWLFPKALTEDMVGLTRVIINVALLFSVFASLGASQIPSKFFPYFNDEKKQHNGFLSFLLMLGGVGFLLFVSLLLFFKPVVISVFIKNAPQIIDFYYHLIPFTLIVLVTNIFDSYITIQGKPVVPSFIREFLVRFFLALSLLAVLLQLADYNQFVWMIIGFYFVCLVILAIYIAKQRVLFLKPSFKVFKSEHFKPIMVFGGFVLMANASGTIIANIDSLMLSAYSGLRSTGIYTIAFFIAAVIEVPRRSMSQVLIPLVSEANKNNDIAKLSELYKKSSLNQLIIGCFLFLAIWCNIDNVFKFVPNGSVYAEGKWVVFYIGLSKLFDMASGINAEIVGTSKYYKIDLVFYIVLGGVAIITNMILIPIYGLTGAAIASLLSLFFVNAIRFVFLKVKMNIQPFSINTLAVVIIAVTVLFLDSLTPRIPNHFVADIAIRTAGILLAFFIPILVFNVSTEISDQFSKVIKRLFAR